MRFGNLRQRGKVVISRSGEVLISDDHGRERERYKVLTENPAGRFWKTVREGAELAAWDPHTRPIITEYAGTARFENVEEGVTVAKQMDDVTGLSTLVCNRS